MLGKLIVFCTFFFMLGLGHVRAQEIDNRMKSLYVYNFTKYIDWPEETKKGNFVIGVLGDDELFHNFEHLCETKKVNGQKIVIKKLLANEEANGCQIVFIAKHESSRVVALTEITAHHPVMLVSEKGGMIKKGSNINLFLDDDDDNKTKFDINKKTVEIKGMKVSTFLLTLATTVY
jgi:hypothetical protein